MWEPERFVCCVPLSVGKYRTRGEKEPNIGMRKLSQLCYPPSQYEFPTHLGNVCGELPERKLEATIKCVCMTFFVIQLEDCTG